MARLPIPGKDAGVWGDVLNDYLSQAHAADGTLKQNAVTTNAIAPDAITAAEIQNGTITEAQLDAPTQAKLNTVGSGNVADGTITNAKLHDDAVTDTKITDGTISETKLATAVQAKLNQAAPTWSTLGGKPVVVAAGADQAAARQAIGAGTSNLTLGTSGSTAKAGDYQPSWADVTSKPAVMAVGATQADARSAIGAGTSNLTLGTTGSTAAAGDDARLTNTRTPTDNSVSTAKLQNGSITNDKIADDAIAEGKLSSAVQSKLNAAAPTWSSLSGKPNIIAAGSSSAVARAAIGGGADVDATVDFGTVGDGIADDTEALQDAINAVPNGGTLLIRAGRYRITGQLSCLSKSITINAHGAVLYRDGDPDPSNGFTALRIAGSFESVLNVNSITPTTFDEGTSEDIAALVIEITPPDVNPSPPAWAKGDVVKLVADDVIPGSRPTGTSEKCRVGQFFSVRESSGYTVTLVGNLHDPFTTGIRIAKLVKHSVEVNGLRVESNNINTWTNTAVTVQQLYCPRIQMTFGQQPSVAVGSQSNYQPYFDLVLDGGNNKPAENQPTYGVLDSASENGYFRIMATGLRHCYSDGTLVTEPQGSVLRYYGRPYGHLVTGVGHGTLASAWDTHSTAMNVTFANCVANDCDNGFALRGMHNTVLNGVVNNCHQGLTIFDEDDQYGDADSYGHHVDGLILRNSPLVRIQSNVASSWADSYGDRVTIPSRIDNLTITGADADLTVYVINQTVRFGNVRIALANAVDNEHSTIRIVNSDISFESLEWDLTSNTSGSDIHAFHATSDSIINCRRFRGVWPSGVESRIDAIAYSETGGTVMNIDDVDIPHNMSFSNGDLGADSSKLDFFARDTGHTMAWAGVSGTGVASTSTPSRVARSKRAILHIRCGALGADRVLGKLQPGSFRGQMIVVANTDSANTYTVTVNDSTGGAGTVNLNGNVVLRYGESACWIWDGSYWYQTWTSLSKPVGSTALNFGSVSAQSYSDLTIAVNGAATGDSVSLGVPTTAVTAGIVYSAWVSATNTVTVRAHNYTSGALDPASGTFKATIIR